MYTVNYSYCSHSSTQYKGIKYDSKFEAGVAVSLDKQLSEGLIKGWQPKFKVICVPYNIHGDPVMKCKVEHVVDFRVHQLDDSFELLEAKGIEFGDYRMRRKWLELFWLPANLDHSYRLIKQRKRGY